MSKQRKDPLLVALAEGRSYTWSVPDGGNLASMRKAIQHGQTLTMAPVTDPGEIHIGDLVLVKWHQSIIFHVVGGIQEGRFLIVNSLGKENGWVDPDQILGRVTKVVDPEPRPGVDALLDELEKNYHLLAALDQASPEELGQFLSIVADLRWYAGRIGAERHDQMPRSNKWSYHQNLWHLVKEVRQPLSPHPHRVLYFIDSGKRCVGLSSEIFSLFEYPDPDQ